MHREDSTTSLLDREARRELQACGTLHFNAPMKEYTTFKTGGPADMLITPRRTDDVSTIIQIARRFEANSMCAE